jgi:hypothetical protein
VAFIDKPHGRCGVSRGFGRLAQAVLAAVVMVSAEWQLRSGSLTHSLSLSRTTCNGQAQCRVGWRGGVPTSYRRRLCTHDHGTVADQYATITAECLKGYDRIVPRLRGCSAAAAAAACPRGLPARLSVGRDFGRCLGSTLLADAVCTRDILNREWQIRWQRDNVGRVARTTHHGRLCQHGVGVRCPHDSSRDTRTHDERVKVTRQTDTRAAAMTGARRREEEGEKHPTACSDRIQPHG